jgi:hypothetical protein
LNEFIPMSIGHITSLSAMAVSAAAFISCTSVQDGRTEALENRIDRQNDRIESRSTRRAMRAEAEDQRYHDWYDRVMGRSGTAY